MYNIGIIRESRSDDNRTPLVPKHIKELLNKFDNISIIVQPSNHRCFNDREYSNMGAKIDEDLRACDLILGIKEIEPNLLINAKKYMFFSHTAKIQPDNSAAAQGTPGMDKKELIKEILKRKITLIDYENIRDKLSRRYLGFGRFAGIIGCYNSLNLYLETTDKPVMSRAYDLGSYSKLLKNIEKKDFKNARILITGDGRVAKGTLELLKLTNMNEVSPENFLKDKNSLGVFCNLQTSQYLKRIDDQKFDLQHFIKFPNKYLSIINQYMYSTSILISSHYWDPKSPRLFEKKDLENYKKLIVIGDITCDINGSIPTTLRSTTIKDPNFYLDKKLFKEINKNNKALAIMAVDNLPSELPKDSSEEFGDGIVKEVLPYILNKDDGRINKATITKNGKLLTNYSYINNYIKNNENK